MCILTQAANILNTSEFKVPEFAYQHWFGEQALSIVLKQKNEDSVIFITVSACYSGTSNSKSRRKITSC